MRINNTCLSYSAVFICKSNLFFGFPDYSSPQNVFLQTFIRHSQKRLSRLRLSGGSRKKYLGSGPLSFGRQQWLREITIEPIKNWGAGQDLGEPVPQPQPKTATAAIRFFKLTWRVSSCIID